MFIFYLIIVAIQISKNNPNVIQLYYNNNNFIKIIDTLLIKKSQKLSPILISLEFSLTVRLLQFIA